jgi:hypothetical protein
VLAFGTQVRGFKPDQSRQDFSGRKYSQRAFLRRASKAVGPMSQIPEDGVTAPKHVGAVVM